MSHRVLPVQHQVLRGDHPIDSDVLAVQSYGADLLEGGGLPLRQPAGSLGKSVLCASLLLASQSGRCEPGALGGDQTQVQ